jgi:hypothetical protein
MATHGRITQIWCWLQRLARTLGVAERVRFLGRMPRARVIRDLAAAMNQLAQDPSRGKELGKIARGWCGSITVGIGKVRG